MLKTCTAQFEFALKLDEDPSQAGLPGFTVPWKSHSYCCLEPRCPHALPLILEMHTSHRVVRNISDQDLECF